MMMIMMMTMKIVMTICDDDDDGEDDGDDDDDEGENSDDRQCGVRHLWKLFPGSVIGHSQKPTSAEMYALFTIT